MYTVEAIRWTPEGVVILDQLRLPREVTHHTYTDYRDVAKAIKDMIIRGAPAIGVAAAMGVALGVEHSPAQTLPELRADFATICDTLAHTRPTAESAQLCFAHYWQWCRAGKPSHCVHWIATGAKPCLPRPPRPGSRGGEWPGDRTTPGGAARVLRRAGSRPAHRPVAD